MEGWWGLTASEKALKQKLSDGIITRREYDKMIKADKMTKPDSFFSKNHAFAAALKAEEKKAADVEEVENALMAKYGVSTIEEARSKEAEEADDKKPKTIHERMEEAKAQNDAKIMDRRNLAFKNSKKKLKSSRRGRDIKKVLDDNSELEETARRYNSDHRWFPTDIVKEYVKLCYDKPEDCKKGWGWGVNASAFSPDDIFERGDQIAKVIWRHAVEPPGLEAVQLNALIDKIDKEYEQSPKWYETKKEFEADLDRRTEQHLTSL